MLKEKYELAEIELIAFTAKDVLFSSGYDDGLWTACHLDNVLPFDTDCFFQLRAYNASGQPIGKFSDVYAYRTNKYFNPYEYYI